MIENFWNSEEVNLNNIELSEDDKKIIEKWVLIQSIMEGYQYQNIIKRDDKVFNEFEDII